jgi:serine/threonine protein kinase
MSSVYLAQETALGRRVVIKILPPALAHAMSGERFRQEIRFAARLRERHELLLVEPSPPCSPMLEPLRRLENYKELMDKYRMRICG